MRYLIFIPVSVLVGCYTVDIKNITGLWQLEEVKVDAMEMLHPQTLLEIHANNSFAVSRTSGDLSGLYELHSKKLSFISKDKQWFNRGWQVNYYEQYLILKDTGVRKTKLKFRRIDRVPDFQEFEDMVVGNWELYKIRKGKAFEKLADTWFNIDGNGSYTITNADGIQENGKVVINTRHRKVIFENDSIAWNAWFFGKELRLGNDKLEIQYCLRKTRL